MAEVYRASVRVAEGLTKWVVIKKIRPEFADQREFTRMFVDEAKIALSLNHANIVQVFDFGQVDGTFYLAMELIEGIDLMRLFHAVRAPGDAFPGVIAAYVGHQVASGLAYAHRKTDEYGNPLGIVHRDVSPHNVMISFEGQVKVLDFGIARTRDPLDVRRRPDHELETIKGKVAYMSPEQAHGRPLDARADVYSLGVVLYEVLTGELLFRMKDRLAALDKVRSQPIPPILERMPDIDGDLARIVDRGLRRDPDERYPDVKAMQVDLARYLHRSDPVVDDEVLARFVGQFRPSGRHDTATAAARGARFEQLATREFNDSQVSGLPNAGVRRVHQRVVLLHAVFEPRRGSVGESQPDQAAHDDAQTAAAQTRLGRFLDVVRDIAFKREALAHRVDRTGATLAFGTVLSTGEDPERALRVALALREAIGESAPGVGLGVVVIETHVVVRRDEAGRAGLELPRGLDEALETVSTQAVDRHVVVAGGLVERLHRAWRFGETGAPSTRLPEQSAGTPWAAELASLAPLLGPRSQTERRGLAGPGRDATLHGRELELKTLRDSFSEAIRLRESRSVLVVGEPGIGKRSLLDAFLASLPRGACVVLRSTGQWSQRNRPFGVFLELLRRFLLLDRHSSVPQIAEKLRDYGVDDAETLANVLASALGLADAANRDTPPELEGVSSEALERRQLIGRLVRRLFRALASRRPVLVVIENLHFVDGESAEILDWWATQRYPLPILGISTSREGLRAEAMSQREEVTILQLGELDPRARRELILSRFEDPEEASPIADAVLARTGGNPLFIEEVLASLIDRGVLGWNARARHLVVRDRTADIALPPSVEEALAARIEELDAGDREVLEAAAVLGRTFRAEELPPLLDRDVSDNVESLVERGLVGVAGDDDAAESTTLRFATVSLHEVCKGHLPPTAARLLHGRAADLKRRRTDYAPGRDDGPIVEHLIAAGRAADVVEPALRAARDAQDVAGNVEAYYYLSRAIDAMSEADPRRFDALVDRERILRAWGKRRAQGADIRQMVRVAELARDRDRATVAATRLLRFYLECGRPRRAAQLVPRLERQIEGLEHPEPFWSVLGELRAELALASGDLEAAETFARDALPYCWGDARGVRHRCRLLSVIGRVQSARAAFEDARETFEEVLALARSIKNRRLAAEALNSLGEVAARNGNYQRAVDQFREALAIDRELGDRVSTGTKLANLGLTYTAIGLYRHAERYLRKALELHEAVEHPTLLNDAMMHLGEVVAAQGDSEAAVALLRDAADVAVKLDAPRAELRATVRLARIRFEQGTPEAVQEAEQLAKTVLERARARGRRVRSPACRALQVLAHIAESRGDLEGAIELEREAADLVRAGAAPTDGVLAVHHLGTLLRKAGRDAEADAHLREAAERVRGRLEVLTDPELRAGYLALPQAQRVLDDDPG